MLLIVQIATKIELYTFVKCINININSIYGKGSPTSPSELVKWVLFTKLKAVIWSHTHSGDRKWSRKLAIWTTCG